VKPKKQDYTYICVACLKEVKLRQAADDPPDGWVENDDLSLVCEACQGEEHEFIAH
jgi:hypothetical protein